MRAFKAGAAPISRQPARAAGDESVGATIKADHSAALHALKPILFTATPEVSSGVEQKAPRPRQPETPLPHRTRF